MTAAFSVRSTCVRFCVGSRRPHSSRGADVSLYFLASVEIVPDTQKTVCLVEAPFPVPTGSGASDSPARRHAGGGEETGCGGRAGCDAQREPVPLLARLDLGSVSGPRLALHSSGRDGYQLMAPGSWLPGARYAAAGPRYPGRAWLCAAQRSEARALWRHPGSR